MLGKYLGCESVVGGNGRCGKSVVVVDKVIDVDAECRELCAPVTEERDTSSEPFREFAGSLSCERQSEDFFRSNPVSRDEPQRTQRHRFCFSTAGACEYEVDSFRAHVNNVGLFGNRFESESEEFV